MTLCIGIIMPTFQRLSLLQRAVASVQQQDHHAWNLYIVDDGSTDGTQAWMATVTDTRIHYLRQPSNYGVNAARNRALESLLANQDDVVTLLDDDDIFLPGALSGAVTVVQATPQYAWFVTGCLVNTKKPTALGPSGPADYITDCIFGKRIRGDTTHFIRASAIGKTRFSRTIRQSEEWIFFFGLAATQAMFVYDGVATRKEYAPTGLLASRPNRTFKHAIITAMARCALALRPQCQRARRARLVSGVKSWLGPTVVVDVVDARGNSYP